MILQAASIEDETIRFCVYIYNVQPGVTIDYQMELQEKPKKETVSFSKHHREPVQVGIRY